MSLRTKSPAVAEPVWRNRTMRLTALALLVLLGMFLRVSSQAGVQQRTPDEQGYTKAANAFAKDGRSALATLAEALHGDTMSSGNPVRAGYLFVLGGVMDVTGRHDETAGATLACAASLMSMGMFALFAWRRFPLFAGLAATLLYAVSPLALMTSRRAWQEALIELLALFFLFVAAETTAGVRTRWLYALFCFAGFFSITVKQTAAVSFALCAAWIAGVLLLRGERRLALWFVASCTAAGALAVGVLSWLLGGVHTFLQLERTNSLDQNTYSVAYEGGPGWWLARAFWTVSPAVACLCVIALIWVFNLRRPVPVERRIALLLVLLVSFFFAPAVLLPHHLNLRYVAVTYAPLALLAGLGASFLLDMGSRIFPLKSVQIAAAIGACIVALAAVDSQHFDTAFAATDMQDLSVRMVLALPAPENVSTTVTNPPQHDFDSWMALARKSVQAGDCAMAIEAAKKATEMDGKSAVAWNNLAAGYECSRQWVPAIEAARKALQLNPDFQLALNNLNWSLEQQKLEAEK